MSIVGPWLADARVLDLFAGSGALGLEALSRGASHVDLVDVSPRSITTIRENAERLGAGDQLAVHRADALRFVRTLEPGGYDVAFADPPYDLGLAARVAACWLERPFATHLGVEHRAGESLPHGGTTRRYGGTAITFFHQTS
jgi:16S rRNA (guanine966-N2)-methyltransferase